MWLFVLHILSIYTLVISAHGFTQKATTFMKVGVENFWVSEDPKRMHKLYRIYKGYNAAFKSLFILGNPNV